MTFPFKRVYFFSILLLLLGIVFMYIFTNHKISQKKNILSGNNENPIVYLVPHQDDETISMSVDIVNNIQKGHRVILWLYTDGGGSMALKLLNGEFYSSYWKGVHNPSCEGYHHLDKRDFIDARNNEFKSASGQLGVKPQDIIISPLPKLNINSIKDVVLKFHEQYPSATFRAMSYKDSHHQHALGGMALKELIDQRKVEGLFFVSRFDYNKNLYLGSPITTNHSNVQKILRAINCYKAWNPAVGSYAIGYHSVSGQFENFRKKPQNKIHCASE